MEELIDDVGNAGDVLDKGRDEQAMTSSADQQAKSDSNSSPLNTTKCDFEYYPTPDINLLGFPA